MPTERNATTFLLRRLQVRLPFPRRYQGTPPCVHSSLLAGNELEWRQANGVKLDERGAAASAIRVAENAVSF